MQRYNLGTKKVLDIGCAYGANLLFWGEGSQGLEIGEEKVRFAQALGLNVAHADLNRENDLAAVPDNYFDAVWCAHVLEHLPAPHTALSLLRNKLHPGGMIFVLVPTVPQSRLLEYLWRIYLRGLNTYAAEEHLYAFTSRTVAYLIEKAGYQLVERNIFFPALGPMNDVVNALIRDSWRQITVVAKRV